MEFITTSTIIVIVELCMVELTCHFRVYIFHLFYIYTELIIERQATSQSDDGIGPGATAGIAVTLLVMIIIITIVVITVVIVIIR